MTLRLLSLATALAVLAGCGLDGPPQPPEPREPGVSVRGSAEFGVVGGG